MPTSNLISASKFLGKDRYDYYLNELITEKTLGGHQLSNAQLKEGFKKRTNKISFEKFVDKVISSKTVKASVNASPTAAGGLGRKGGALVKSPAGGIQKIQISPDQKEVGGVGGYLKDIIGSLGNIIKFLNAGVSADIKNQEQKRRDRERSKRESVEKGLEKGFSAVKKVVDKVVAPVKSILSRIINFFLKMFLARIVVKLIDWLADPKNQEKVRSLVRFFGDHWVKLLSLYIVFGTSFGKFARGLISLVIRSTIKLGAAVAGLAVKVGLGKAGGKLSKVAGFLGGKKGKLLAAGLEAGATVVGTMALTKTLEGDGDNQQNTQGFSGGGYVTPRFPAFAGGGFNFKGMMGGASMGAMFGPLGMLLGGALGGSSGFVSGEKGVDKVPAMLSDGEFVMSRGAVAKYGVDTLESMNAAGGGTNKPKIMSGTTYAQGGGLIGDIPLASSYGTNPNDNTLRRAARTFNRFGTEDELFKAFKKLGGVPDFAKLVGGESNFVNIQQGKSGADATLENILNSAREKLKAVNNPQSFTQSSRAAAGLDDLAKKFDLDAKTAQRYGDNLPRLGRPKPKVTRIDPRRMLPAAGQSSANAMRAAARSARPPIPATSAIVPYTGGGLARTGVTAGLSVPQIRTNMKVPGGFGNLKSLGAELLLSYLVQSGLDYVEAKRLASTIEKARKESPEKLANRIEQLRELVDKEERFQKSFGGVLQKVIALGGETGSEVLSRQAKTILAGVGAKTFQGGAIKGGYGLKQQSFKDMPKTQIMTDDKGRPFVGYKAMRGGKPVYVRGPQPGTGTTNPLEALGRMINPGAYRENDQRLAMQKQKIAMVDALEGFQKQGMAPDAQARMMKQMGGNLKDVQNDLTYRKKTAKIAQTKPKNSGGVNPPTRPTPKYTRAGGGMGKARGAMAAARRSSATTQAPAIKASHPQGTRRNQAVLGIKSK